MKKISDEIKKTAGELKRAEAKLEAARVDEENCTERGKLSEIRTDIAFLEKQAVRLKSAIQREIEKFLKKGAKTYKPETLEDHERDIILEGGRSLAILIEVLSTLRRGDLVRELNYIQIPPRIRDQAAAYKNEAVSVVDAYNTEKLRKERFAAVVNNREMFANRRQRIFGMVMKNDFSGLEA